jgi:hypothetical protein
MMRCTCSGPCCSSRRSWASTRSARSLNERDAQDSIIEIVKGSSAQWTRRTERRAAQLTMPLLWMRLPLQVSKFVSLV